MPTITLPERHYKAGSTGEGTDFTLPDGKVVILERYENRRRVTLLWPTILKPKAFFDKATTVLGFDYDSVREHSGGGLSIPKYELDDRDSESTIASIDLPDKLGELAWESAMLTKGDLGGIVSRRFGDIAIEPLITETGTELTVANLGAIVTQTMALLS